MFWETNFKAINLLQKANLNENLLWKADLNGKKIENYNSKILYRNSKPYIKMVKKL